MVLLGISMTLWEHVDYSDPEAVELVVTEAKEGAGDGDVNVRPSSGRPLPGLTLPPLSTRPPPPPSPPRNPQQWTTLMLWFAAVGVESIMVNWGTCFMDMPFVSEYAGERMQVI